MPCFNNNINRDAIKTAIINDCRNGVFTDGYYGIKSVEGLNMINGIPVYAYIELIVGHFGGVITICVRNDSDPNNRYYGGDPENNGASNIVNRCLYADVNGHTEYTMEDIIDILENDIDWDEDIWNVQL